MSELQFLGAIILLAAIGIPIAIMTVCQEYLSIKPPKKPGGHE